MKLITKEIVLGGSLLAGIVGISMILRNSQTKTQAPANPSSPGPTLIPPANMQTITVTEVNNGQNISLAVGDTLLVNLQLTGSITSYDYNMSSVSQADMLTAGNLNNLGSSISQAWVAVYQGTATLTYIPSDGSPSIVYNVTVIGPVANA